MGHEIREDDPVLGFPCPHWINPPETPSKIYVMFFGIEACPGHAEPPNLRLFTLYQDPLNPCFWVSRSEASGFSVQFGLYYVPPLSVLFCEGGPLESYFYGTGGTSPPEHYVYANEILYCVGSLGGIGGEGIIFWLEAASDLIADYVLPVDEKILFEFSVNESGKPIYKFTIPAYSANVKFLLEP